MATITIKDLPESIDLDREAMHAVIGGARGGNRQAYQLQKAFGNIRIVDYPPGVKRSLQPVKDLLPRR
jgi:hypothetical protein